MAETLTVHVNRDGIHSVEAPGAVESEGSLVLDLRNHGEATHVHLRLDGDLASVASLGETNLYVEGGRRRVDLDVGDVRTWPVTGELEISTGYGQEAATVAVTLAEPTPAEPAEPDPDVSVSSDDGGSPGTGGQSGPAIGAAAGTARRVLPVALLAILAIALAAVAVQVGGQTAMLGSAVVVLAVIVAGVLLYRG